MMAPPTDETAEHALRIITRRIGEVEYGEVLVVVHQGQVTEVRVTKRERIAGVDRLREQQLDSNT